MKKRILIWGLMLMTAISTSFANSNENVNRNVISAFHKDFSSAREVKWESKKEFDIATFTMNGQVQFAYYSKSGELIAVTRNILSNQLPVMLQKQLKKRYHGYWISNLFEIDVNGDTTYYVTLENQDYTMVMKSSGTLGWELFSMEHKK
ncbi:MAG TPA: hypothetical protein VMH01_00680 [Puia sp.]|nr:hypothetical protein [Puia sp.]